MHIIQVLTVSDRVAAGTAEDTAGAARALLAEQLPGWEVSQDVVPDRDWPVLSAVAEACARGARVVLTLVGTGVSPRDRTPEAVAPLITRDLPGIGELLRRAGREKTPAAVLSRGRVGVVDPKETDGQAHGSAVVVNLPGSRASAEQGVVLLAGLLPHLVDQLDGGDHVRH